MNRRGFTLIELLVVIAIIAILAAILFPVFLTAKERGRQAKCCSNLKELTMAFFNYADDHDGYLPIGSRRLYSKQFQSSPEGDIEWTGTTWFDTSDPMFPPIDVRQGSLYKGGYARTVGVFQCPSDVDLPSYRPDGSKVQGPPSTTPGFGLSYAINQYLALKYVADGTVTTIKLSPAVAGRSGQILFLIHETRGDSKHYGINDGYFSWSNSDPTGRDFFDKIHYDGTTCSYSDGHVKWISNRAMQKCEDDIPSPWWRNSFYYHGSGMPDANYSE